jgi:hypothetical protein
MSGESARKISVPYALKLTTNLSTTPVFRMTDQVIGELILSATLAANITSLTFYTAIIDYADSLKPELNPEFVLAADVGTAGVMTVAAGNAYQFPTQLIGAAFVKIVANVAGTIWLNVKS